VKTFESVQSQLFTRQRPDANSPNPGLLNLLRKKIVIASEPKKFVALKYILTKYKNVVLKNVFFKNKLIYYKFFLEQRT
jgi:hypothetical protein